MAAVWAVVSWTVVDAHTVIVYPGWRGNNLITNDTFPYAMQWMYPCKLGLFSLGRFFTGELGLAERELGGGGGRGEGYEGMWGGDADVEDEKGSWRRLAFLSCRTSPLLRSLVVSSSIKPFLFLSSTSPLPSIKPLLLR